MNDIPLNEIDLVISSKGSEKGRPVAGEYEQTRSANGIRDSHYIGGMMRRPSASAFIS